MLSLRSHWKSSLVLFGACKEMTDKQTGPIKAALFAQFRIWLLYEPFSPVKNSTNAGAITVGSTSWVCPSRLRHCPLGRVLASTCAVSAIQPKLADPLRTSVGVLTEAAR